MREFLYIVLKYKIWAHVLLSESEATLRTGIPYDILEFSDSESS